MVNAGTIQPPTEANQVFEANLGHFLDPSQARAAFDARNPAIPIAVPFRVVTTTDPDLGYLSASSLEKLDISGWKYFLVRDRKAIAAGDVIDAGTPNLPNYVLSAVTFGRYPRVLYDAVTSLGRLMHGAPGGRFPLEILIFPELRIHAVCPTSPIFEAYVPRFERPADDPGYVTIDSTHFLDDVRGRLNALVPAKPGYTVGP
ncbi:MAG TPA: hypothetical protein VKQ29_05850 [Aliidongia sp.]|nr:hypothetical protein [Aliidongia sp.]